MKAEYIGMTEATKESMWLGRLLANIRGRQIKGYDDKRICLAYKIDPTDGAQILYADNQGAIAMAENPTHHNRNKHIDVKYRFLQEAVRRGDISLKYLRTTDMPADLLTKSLARVKHKQHVQQMGICDVQTVSQKSGRN
jgi:hypothetical protein